MPTARVPICPPFAISRRAALAAVLAAPLVRADSAPWIDLFDGHSLTGWRPSENKASWSVVDGALTAHGARSHLFYDGPVHGADFRNFELEVELVTQPDCNSGVYFHTRYQETGFPEKGFEIQVNNTALGEGGYLERKKTGSLYGLRNMYKQLVPDRQPFRMRATVRGKNVQIHLNDELLVDYVEPTPPVIPAGGEKERFLDHGTFALQCHNNGSYAAYKYVRVRPLSDALPAYVGPPPVVDETYRRIIDIGRHNLPMVDYHVNLAPGLTLDAALGKMRACGIQYGIATRAASLHSDSDAERALAPLLRQPVFYTLVTEGPEWTKKLSRTAALRFDCIVAQDAVPAPSLAARIDHAIQRLDSEPIDIYSWRTAGNTADSWTPALRSRLIQALVRNKVALELNTLDQFPPVELITDAKAADCKFAFGTGNRTAAELHRCEYGLAMVETCKLDWKNFFIPGAWAAKSAERKMSGS